MRLPFCFVLWTLLTAQAAPCPDFEQAVDDATDALARRDPQARAAAVAEAEQALRCGPIVSSWQARARYWVAKAVDLDAAGDIDGSELAMLAAWRTWPDVPLVGVPDALLRRHLVRLDDSADAPISALQLVPPPPSTAVVIIDGVAASQAGAQPGDLGPRFRVSEGMHLLQLLPSIEVLAAVAGVPIVVEAEDRGATRAMNIIDIDRSNLGEPSLGDVELPPRLIPEGPRGGCAAHR